MNNLVIGISGCGKHIGPWNLLPFCPNCNKNSLWIYPEKQKDIRELPSYDDMDQSSVYIACRNECGFKTKAFPEVKDCLKSAILYKHNDKRIEVYLL